MTKNVVVGLSSVVIDRFGTMRVSLRKFVTVAEPMIEFTAQKLFVVKSKCDEGAPTVTCKAYSTTQGSHPMLCWRQTSVIQAIERCLCSRMVNVSRADSNVKRLSIRWEVCPWQVKVREVHWFRSDFCRCNFPVCSFRADISSMSLHSTQNASHPRCMEPSQEGNTDKTTVRVELVPRPQHMFLNLPAHDCRADVSATSARNSGRRRWQHLWRHGALSYCGDCTRRTVQDDSTDRAARQAKLMPNTPMNVSGNTSMCKGP